MDFLSTQLFSLIALCVTISTIIKGGFDNKANEIFSYFDAIVNSDNKELKNLIEKKASKSEKVLNIKNKTNLDYFKITVFSTINSYYFSLLSIVFSLLIGLLYWRFRIYLKELSIEPNINFDILMSIMIIMYLLISSKNLYKNHRKHRKQFEYLKKSCDYYYDEEIKKFVLYR